MNTGAKYISVTMYDAEKKKNINKTIKRDNFKNEKHLQNYIEEMKTQQRKKNRIYKEKHKMDKYNEILRQDDEDEEEVKKQSNKTIKNVTLNHMDNFILDKETGNTTVIFGSSKRGKSTRMIKIYKQFYEPDKNFISTLFTGNTQIPIYKSVKRLLISDGFNKRSEKYIQMQKYINMQTNNHYSFLNMFDDIIDIKYKTLINKLVLTYRNANISTIMCLQYAYLLSKQNRANVNNIIIFGCNSDEAIKDMIDTFLKSFFANVGITSFKDQYNFFKDVTHDYGFFYINNIKGKISVHRIPN